MIPPAHRTRVPCLLLLTAGLLGASKVPAADPDREAVGEVLRAVARTTGIDGRPGLPAPSRAVEDPRAVELARQVAEHRGARRDAKTVAPPSATPAAAPPQRGARQLAAFRQLVGPAAGDVELHLRPENGTVRHMRGPLLAPQPSRLAGATAADRDLATGRALLVAAAEVLGIPNPDEAWRLDRVENDDLGGRRLRFTQHWQGLQVWPSALTAHLDALGRAVAVDGAYAPSPVGLDTEPRLAAEEALMRGRATIPGGMRAEASPPVLLIHAPLGAEPRLAWHFALNLGLVQAWHLAVDASSGRVLLRSNRVLDANVQGSGRDFSGITRPLNVWNAAGTHYLIDGSKRMFKPGSDPVQKPEGAISIGDAALKKINDLKTSDIAHITSANPHAWSLPDGVSAAFNFSKTYDYFLDVHGRNSLDGAGGNVTAVVRIGEYDNASWNGNVKIMLFGNVQPYADALDVVGHELTHGLTEASAGLVYENQSGALNEAFSDIFGEMVEAYATGALDWKMGTKLSRVFRDFKQPGSLTIGGLNRPYPARMSEFVALPNTDDSDHGGVHINSSIINHCFWQLAEGLPSAIGRADAARIFFRTLTAHLQPQSQFVDARLGAIASAEALFGTGSTQAAATAAAFDAVEILAAPQTPPPPSVPVVQAPDSTLFVATDPLFGEPALYRSEAALGDPPDGTFFTFGTLVSRPAISGDGEEVLYVSADHDLCYTQTGDPSADRCFGFAGQVQSVAISPDGHFGAFVFRDPLTGQADNRISILDLAQGTSASFELLAPAIDGAPVDAVLFADAMVFSTDSSILYYDAVSRLRFGTGPVVFRSSIYAMHLATGKMTIVVPPIEGVDTGNPQMGRTGNRHMVFEALVEATGNSVVLTLDLFTGDAAQVGSSGGGLAYPVFTGDESALVYAQRDGRASTTGFSLVRQPLGPDRLSAQGDPTLWTFDARLGALYRRGQFTGTNALPTVTITSPAANATLPVGTPATFAVNASDTDGSIARVLFYDGDDLLGEDTSAPFSLTWTPAAPGAHRLIARATDDLGGTSDSAPVTFTVGSGGTGSAPRLSAVGLPGNRLRIVVRGDPGNYIVARSTDLRTWTDLHSVTVNASGEGQVEEPALPGDGAAFYRVRRP